MISKSLRRIAADSNVILSAIIGKAALRVFTVSDLEVMTTYFNLQEVQEYLPYFSQRYKIDEFVVRTQLNMLPLSVVHENTYKNRLTFARKLLNNTDPDDAHLMALALSENIPIWSNDKHFKDSLTAVYTTAKLLKVLNV